MTNLQRDKIMVMRKNGNGIIGTIVGSATYILSTFDLSFPSFSNGGF